MGLDEDYAAAAAPLVLETQGEAAVYTPALPASTPVGLTAYFGPEQTRPLEDQDGRTKYRHRVVQVSTDPAGAFGGVAAPARGDRIVRTADGSAWSVNRVESAAGGLALVRVVRPEKTELSGRNSRDPFPPQ